ncbi:hypothetical protein HGRIS_002988 [Hohenbuehelia grisea]|uniref:Uncharacterized protein n=1 Tax=Hohenbuehelia grisea TaxID=104357 RepID=A0ABR3JN40_9AGAR
MPSVYIFFSRILSDITLENMVIPDYHLIRSLAETLRSSNNPMHLHPGLCLCLYIDLDDLAQTTSHDKAEQLLQEYLMHSDPLRLNLTVSTSRHRSNLFKIILSTSTRWKSLHLQILNADFVANTIKLLNKRVNELPILEALCLEMGPQAIDAAPLLAFSRSKVDEGLGGSLGSTEHRPPPRSGGRLLVSGPLL